MGHWGVCLVRRSVERAAIMPDTLRGGGRDEHDRCPKLRPGRDRELNDVDFVCVHNAGCSQMAADLLDYYAVGKVHVRSAGSTPGDQINPAAVEALAEVGLDLSTEFPKPLTDDVVHAADVVITMGYADVRPLYLGKRHLDWELDDLAGKPPEEIRPIRDEIGRRVQGSSPNWSIPPPVPLASTDCAAAISSPAVDLPSEIGSPSVGLGPTPAGGTRFRG